MISLLTFYISLLKSCVQLPLDHFPMQTLIPFWVFSPENFREPVDPFEKVYWNKVGFEDCLREKLR